MKAFKKLLLTALAVLFFCGCGGEMVKSYNFSNAGIEVIKVTLKTDGGYDLKYEGSQFMAYKDKKEVLKGHIETADFWQQVEKAADKNEMEVIEKTDEKISWIKDNMINTLQVIPGGIGYGYSYADLSSGITREEYEAAAARISYETTTEDPSEYIEF